MYPHRLSRFVGAELLPLEDSSMVDGVRPQRHAHPAVRLLRAFRPTIRSQRIRGTLFQLVGLAMAALAVLAYAFGLLRPLELGVVDAHFSVRGKRKPPADVVVVAIDAATFDSRASGGLGLQWPFPRSVHGRLIDVLRRDGARAIAIDIQFTEQTAPKEDNALVDAVARAHGRVVLATTEVDANGHTNVFGGDDVVRELGARVGNSNYETDTGGTIRRIAYSIDKLRAFPIVAAEVAMGRRIDRSALGGRSTWIDFAGPPGTIRTVSYADAVLGRVPASVFRGKVVVVGASAPSLQDVHPTSTSGNGVMAGPEIHANSIETALRGFPLSSVPRWLTGAIIVLLSLVPALAGVRLSPLRAIGASFVLAALYVVVTQFAFEHGVVLPFVYPLGGLLLSSGGTLGVHYVLAAFERERVRSVFARFVPEAVVNEVLASADSDLRLGGVQREGTVLFSDLRGFTTFAESRSANEVIDILNRYLSSMSDAILEHGGTLVAFMGDGIMAVFGAPLQQDDHADRALAAACEMLSGCLPSFNDWMRSSGLGEGFRMGIGLNSGPVMAGNVGHERRLEYTAIGDVVNTASRIEGMTKGTAHSLFVADSTRESLLREPPPLEFIGEFDVRGRAGRIRLWSLAPDEATATATAPPGAASEPSALA